MPWWPVPCVSPQPLAFPPAVPAGLLAPPAAALQCCLAGLGPLGGGVVWRENTLYASLNLGDPAYSLQVEVVGKVAGGRWAARVLGATYGQDVAELMVGEAARELEFA